MKLAWLGFLAVFLAACGTTSGVRQNGKEVTRLDLSDFENVVIVDFEDDTRESNVPSFVLDRFSDRIASVLSVKGGFANVWRRPRQGKNALLVKGKITRYEEGNAVLRNLIGLGAGSSYFDAIVEIQNLETGEAIGDIIVDRNSWVLGGGLAAGQTVEVFMEEAAIHVATELSSAKHAESGDVAVGN